MKNLTEDEWAKLYRIVYHKHHRVSHTEWFNDLVQDCALYALEKTKESASQQAMFVAKVGYRLKERYSRPDMGRDVMAKRTHCISLDEAMDRLDESDNANFISLEVNEALMDNSPIEHSHVKKLYGLLLAGANRLTEKQKPVYDAMMNGVNLKTAALAQGITPQAFDFHKNNMLTALRNMYHEQGIYSLSA